MRRGGRFAVAETDRRLIAMPTGRWIKFLMNLPPGTIDITLLHKI